MVRYLFFSLIFILALYIQCNGGLSLPPKSINVSEKIDVYALPNQWKTTKTEFTIESGKKAIKIVPHAEISLQGIVRHVSEAPFMRDAVTKSCALTWGKANREEIQKQVKWDGFSSGFKYDPGSSGAADIVRRNFSNFYFAGATDNLRKAIRRIKVNQDIWIRGYLIDMHHPEGKWETPPPFEIRTDVCNMIWVTQLKIGNRLYQ